MDNLVPSSEPTPPRKTSPFRIVGIGCGGIAAFMVLVIVVFGVMVLIELKKPFRVTNELTGLAGVPIYNGAKLDEETTKSAGAVQRVLRGLYPADSTTVVVLRTSDDPDKILAFYDGAMAKFGFVKTTLGGGLGIRGATYVLEGIRVVIQLQDDPGEDRQLKLMRFDNGPKTQLGKRSDVVTPEDFKKVKADRDAKSGKSESPKATPTAPPQKEKAP